MHTDAAAMGYGRPRCGVRGRMLPSPLPVPLLFRHTEQPILNGGWENHSCGANANLVL